MSKIISFEEGSETLQKGIKKLHNILEGFPEPNFTPQQHIMLYTTVYDMCTQKPPRNYPRELYNMYKETCQEYIISKVLPSLREKNNDHLLRELLRRWSNYQVMTRRLSKFFCYLERRDIPHYGLPSLEETSFISFYYLVYEEMDKEIMDAISAMIDRTRAGEKIDQSVALNTLDLYLELKECARKIKAKEEKMNRGPDVLSKKINLISSDRVVFEVDCGMALMSKRFEDIIATIPVGDVDTISVHEVSSKMLTMVIEYCEKHNNRQKYVDLSDWDAQFVEVDTKTLLDLQTSANYLKIDGLNSLIWEKEYELIKDMTPKEIVQFYSGIEDDSKLLEEKRE
ncbi:cullin-1 [Trifolium repens]|nr:cullin-1 [Trifolium repens]